MIKYYYKTLSYKSGKQAFWIKLKSFNLIYISEGIIKAYIRNNRIHRDEGFALIRPKLGNIKYDNGKERI